VNDRITIAKILIPTAECKGYAVIGCYLASNNNKKNEYEFDLAQLEASYNCLTGAIFKTIVIGDINADSVRNTYTQDKLFANWLIINNKIELTRLFLQPIPFTYLGSRGQISHIDHIIIDESTDWREIRAINICVTKDEYNKLRTSQNWEQDIRGIWDWENNYGDHRALNMELLIRVNVNELEKKIVRVE
jgi:hypothetical protein